MVLANKRSGRTWKSVLAFFLTVVCCRRARFFFARLLHWFLRTFVDDGATRESGLRRLLSKLLGMLDLGYLAVPVLKRSFGRVLQGLFGCSSSEAKFFTDGWGDVQRQSQLMLVVREALKSPAARALERGSQTRVIGGASTAPPSMHLLPPPPAKLPQSPVFSTLTHVSAEASVRAR